VHGSEDHHSSRDCDPNHPKASSGQPIAWDLSASNSHARTAQKKRRGCRNRKGLSPRSGAPGERSESLGRGHQEAL